MEDSEIREQLRSDLERVNFWLGNVDQKAGIILAVIGVVVPIVGSTDKVIEIFCSAISPIFEAIKSQDCLPLLNLGYTLLACISITYLVMVIYYLLLTIDAKIDPKVFRENGLRTDSLLHFQSVSRRFFSTYCDLRVKQMKDLNAEMIDYQSQVYINSIICTTKFENYKQGLHFLRKFLAWFLLTCLVFICNYIYH